MVERFSTMGIQLLCTLVIAQFLPPSEFGLISMMSIFLGFSMVLVDSGFGQAIIKEQNVTELDYSSIFYFNIMLGGVIYLLFFLTAPFIASFYHEAQLTDLIRVAFLSILLLSFSVVQQARLFKSVDFSKVSKISLTAVIISGCLGIVWSVLFQNVWALIVQSLSFALVRTALFWIWSTWHPKLIFSWKALRKYIRFSMNLLGTNLIASITDNLANLFIGRCFSAGVLGNYTVPDKLQRTVAGTISFSIHRVSYPIMASFQNDIDQLRVYSQKIVGMAFFITAPIMGLLFVLSTDFFNIILSPEWTESARYFRYMCIIGAVYCFADVNMDILIIRGKTDMVLRIEILRKALLVLALIIGISYDIEVLLALLVLYNVFNMLFVSFWSGREIKCSLWRQLLEILPTILILASAMVITWGVSVSLSSSSTVTRFSTSILAGTLFYLGSAILCRNKYAIFVYEMVMNFVRKMKS